MTDARLTAGTRVGVFEIVSAIGAGGMAEVYRARDSKLGRDVALKILPELFASDRERLARFEREARTLASLNHPHIGTSAKCALRWDDPRAVSPAVSVGSGSPRRGALRGLALLVAGLATGASAGWWLASSRTAEPSLPHLRLDLTVADKTGPTFEAAVSPDGRTIAYLTDAGVSVRRLDRPEQARHIVTMSGVRQVFWSPDTESVGLATGDTLWRVPASGGEPVRIADIARLPGPFNSSAGAAIWLADNRIVFTTGFTGLLEVSALGGEPRPLIDVETGVDVHNVSALPDGSLLYVVHGGNAADTLEVARGGTRNVVYHAAGQNFTGAMYSPTGHILYLRIDASAELWALPFSADSLTVTGQPFLVVSRAFDASLSADGMMLVTSPEKVRAPGRLAMIGRDARVERTIGPRLSALRMVFPTLSPDGTRVSLALEEGDALALWIFGIGRDTATRVADNVSIANAAWSPDGQRLIVQSGHRMCFSGNCFSLSARALDGGAATALATGWGSAVSPDGRHLLYAAWSGADEWDWEYRAMTGGEPVRFQGGSGWQFGARFSPDGRHVAYVSRETGRDEVFVATFPDGRTKWRISNGGGYWPVWRKDGARLFFAQGTSVREVAVTTAPTFSIGSVADALPAGSLQQSTFFNWPDAFDVNADGTRFLVLKAEAEPPAPVMTVMQNWFAGVAAPSAARGPR